MRAIGLEKFGGLTASCTRRFRLRSRRPITSSSRSRAFGLNHAELHMRRGEWAEAAKAIGIESFGLVKFERNAHA